jgi:capsular exopolysaccharide synthesis family protein
VDVDVGDLDARATASLITFTARSGTAAGAAAVAQGWAETYIQLRHDIDVADIAATIATTTATRDSLAAERERVMEPIHELDRAITAASEAEDPDTEAIGDLSTQRITLLQTLNGQLQPIDTQLATVNASLAELMVKADLLADPDVSARVNATAEVPDRPSSPKPLRNLALGLVVGAILAVGAVLAVASFDDRLRTVDDVEAATGLPNLAEVPFSRTTQRPIDLTPGSLVEEAFQRVVSTIDFAKAAGHEHKVILITSPQSGEAKTSTAARLAMALSNEGRNVLVIGGDLRRPTLSTTLGAPPRPGLADFLTSDEISVDNCLHHVPGRRQLVIMPAGQIRDGRNPAEVLRSPELGAVINKLRDFCHNIIIDGPPLLPVVDALELAAVCDAVVLSLFARRSRRRTVQRALKLLDDTGRFAAHGFVLTATDRRNHGYGSYY